MTGTRTKSNFQFFFCSDGSSIRINRLRCVLGSAVSVWPLSIKRFHLSYLARRKTIKSFAADHAPFRPLTRARKLYSQKYERVPSKRMRLLPSSFWLQMGATHLDRYFAIRFVNLGISTSRIRRRWHLSTRDPSPPNWVLPSERMQLRWPFYWTRRIWSWHQKRKRYIFWHLSPEWKRWRRFRANNDDI